jgi:hypothetical protein
MITLRIDVDYPYPSRAKSFLNIALRIKRRKASDYLKNPLIIAEMINESPKEVKAYWFFTPYTIPDKTMLDLLHPDRHEVALHVANDPYREWKILENVTERTVKYYTIHGTSNLLAQRLWGRKIGEKQAKIPDDFPLKSFANEFQNYIIDYDSYAYSFEVAKQRAEKWISQNGALAFHPEWLFKRNKRTRRGPYHELLKALLEVGK